MSGETEKFIREKAHFCGKRSNSITEYQKCIYLAAEELTLADPSLLNNRQTLLERSRVKVDAKGCVQEGEEQSKRQRK